MSLKTIFITFILITTTVSLATAHEAGTGVGAGPCNTGTTPDTGVVVNHSKIVKVTTTSGAVSNGGFLTGQSGAAYEDQTLAPGKCITIKYKFSCSMNEDGSIGFCRVTSWSKCVIDDPSRDSLAQQQL